MRAAPVPPTFQPQWNGRYPMHQQGPRMEEAMWNYVRDSYEHCDRIYMPVYWDNYHVTTGFGKGVERLQSYYHVMTQRFRGERFWTVTEYRDGPMIDAPDLYVFGAGGTGNAPIPLVCDPHPCAPQAEPKYRATFVGSLKTHPVREELLRTYGDRPGYYIGGSSTTEQFRYLMDNSRWALCPRGTGPTSYRLYEAIQMGCVPVYIGDSYWTPFADELDWTQFCVFVSLEDVKYLDTILAAFDDRWAQMRARCREVYESHFSMAACCRQIAKRAVKL